MDMEREVTAVCGAAAELVKKGWCQNTYARSAIDGHAVSPLADDAAQWCMEGALERAAWDRAGDLPKVTPLQSLAVYMATLERAYWHVQGALLSRVNRYNDRSNRKQEHVVNRLRKAAGEKTLRSGHLL